MKIGFFTDTFAPQINGVVTSIQSAMDYLKDRHSVYVFCSNVQPAVPSTDQVWRFPSVVYPFQKEYRLAWPFHPQFKKIQSLKLDIIHIHTPFTMGYGGLRVAAWLGVPVVHTYHTCFEKYIHYVPILPKRYLYTYAKKESKRFCNRCDAVIVPTQPMKPLLESYGVHKPIHVIPSGINMLTESSVDVAGFTAQYCKPNHVNALFVGRVSIEKNIYFLIDALIRLRNDAFPVHLIIVGDGPERKNVEKIIQKQGLADYVTLTGYLPKPDVFAAYYAADIMLFPSKTETQGLTAVESIMCGTPVIGLDEMGIKDVVVSGVSGILTPDNIDAYVDAIRQWLTVPDFQKRLAQQASQDGMRFLHTHTGQVLEGVYNECMEKRYLGRGFNKTG